MFALKHSVPVLAVTLISLAGARITNASCIGDCDRDCNVIITDLVQSVNVALEVAELSDCPSIDNDLDGRAIITEILIALENDLDGCDCRTGPSTELLFAPQDNQLNVYALDSDDAYLRIPASRGTVNGQVCALPDNSGNFVLGDDTGQPAVRPGWGIYSPDGTFLKKLTLPQRDAEPFVPDPIGCGFDAQGRLFTTAIGSTPGPDGQLSVFFPPTYDESCILDTTIFTPGTLAVDAAGVVYVPQFGGVVRYLPPFPSTVEECATVKGTKETFIQGNGIGSGLGIVSAPNGNLYISSVVLPSVVKEFDATGTFVRDLFPPDTAGTPAGLALDSEGSLYYADLAILVDDDPGPVANHGTVRKITFDENGDPSLPEVIASGLTFPDGIGILPARRETTNYGGSLRRTFYYPEERSINRTTVGNMVPKWRYATGGVITASPAVTDVDLPGEGPTGIVYFPSWDGNLYALRTADGRRLWTFTMKPQPGASYPQASSPTVAWLGDRRVLYIGGGMTMYCIDAVTGTTIWEFDAGTGCTDCRFDPNDVDRRERNEILTSPTVFDGQVYFGMDVDDSRGKGGVYSVRADDGRLVWFLNMNDVKTCRPLPEDNIRRFDGYHSPEALGLPADFSSTRPGCDLDRTANQCGNVWSSGALDARRRLIYFASSNCDTDDDPNTPRPAPPMPPLDEAIFALTLDGELAWVWRPREVDNADLAFGATSQLFEIEIDGRSREVVGIGNKDGTYYVLDRDGVNEITGVRWDDDDPSGMAYWRRTTMCGNNPCQGPAGGIIGSASVGEDRIFFSTAIGFSVANPQRPGTHALNANDGTILWENPVQLPSFAPTVGVPGVVFMGELVSGRLHAYHTKTGSELTTLDARAIPGGIAMASAIIDGVLYVGGGTGTRGGLPDEGLLSASIDTPLSAFCVAGTPGCVDEPLCNDGNACTYDYRQGEGCESEAAPDTLSCIAAGQAGRCENGTCVALPPCDDVNPCTMDFYEDITCVQIPEFDGTECEVGEQTGQCQAGECVVPILVGGPAPSRP